MTKKPWTPQDLKTLITLLAQRLTHKQIAQKMGRRWKTVHAKVSDMGLGKLTPPAEDSKMTAVHLVEKPEVAAKLAPPEFGRLPLKYVDGSEWVRVGLVADTHLCCKEECLAELHNQYDLFKAEGITTVLHAGNPIDGYVARINGESVYSTTIDGQAKYFVDNYPARAGITTYYITGDDHESWFSPGFNIGAYLQHVAEAEKRNDLRYIGHIESDVEFQIKGAGAPTIVKVQHPGGGSAYARSYTGQKIVESLEGGEKPAILVLGHYHVSNYMNERNIHVISLPGFQAQTIFARKKRLRMELGGALLEFKVNLDDGTVTRCRVEFNRYFNRGYYKKFIRSDAYLAKGHLVLKKGRR
jgi:hypothetical protein